MKKISLIALLTLMMTVVSFEGKAQEASSVIVSGRIHGSGSVYIETVKPDYTVELKKYYSKEEKNLLVEIKKNLIIGLIKDIQLIKPILIVEVIHSIINIPTY